MTFQHLSHPNTLKACLYGVVVAWSLAAGLATAAPTAAPTHLRDTGLFKPGSATEVRAENLPFTPQYPLWSDGTHKRRWLYLPPRTAIDASRRQLLAVRKLPLERRRQRRRRPNHSRVMSGARPPNHVRAMAARAAFSSRALPALR